MSRASRHGGASGAVVRAIRRAKVAELAERRFSASHIATELGVSLGLVYADLKLWRDRLAEEGRESSLSLREELAAGLDATIRSAWAEYERSKEDRSWIRRKAQRVADIAGAVEETRHVEGRLGDPRYLELIRSSTVDLLRLYGHMRPDVNVNIVLAQITPEQSLKIPGVERARGIIFSVFERFVPAAQWDEARSAIAAALRGEERAELPALPAVLVRSSKGQE